MSWEAWGEPDEGPNCGECDALKELQDNYDELRKLAWSIVRTTVYQNGKMAEGISLEMIAAMSALHDELIVTEPYSVRTPAEDDRARQAMERIRQRNFASRQASPERSEGTQPQSPSIEAKVIKPHE